MIKLVTSESSTTARLAKALFQVADAAYPKGTAWSLKAFEQDLRAGHRKYAVAYVDEQLVGFVGVIQVLDQVDVTGVAVQPDYQRQGLAQTLFRTLFQSLISKTTIYLEVRASNNGARALYEQLGFELIGKRPHYYQHPDEDAILMKLTVLE